MTNKVLCIDFGTSNCTVTLYSKKTQEEVIPIANHSDPKLRQIADGALFPSKFGLSNDMTYKFGGEVVDCDRDFIWDNSKRLLQYDIPIFRGGIYKKPVWAALGIFAGLYFELKKQKIKTDIPCVISVPANSYSLQRSLTKIAAETIGFNVIQLVSEPCAAALSVLSNFKNKKNILIIDIGGGTTDIALLNNDDGNIREVGVIGIKRFGGLNIDQIIYKQIRRNFQSTSDAEELYIRDLCENAKIDLSYNLKTSLNFRDQKIEITRKQLEGWVSEDILLLEQSILKLLSNNKYEIKDVDVVVPIGGTSNMPIIRKLLKKMFKNKLFDTNYDDSLTSVSKGGSIAAGIKTGLIKDLNFNQCLEHSVGLKAFKNTRDNLVFSTILAKGQKFPAKNIKTFFSQSRKGLLTILESTSGDLSKTDTQVVLTHEIDTGDVDVNVEISYDDDGKIIIQTQSIEKDFLREKDLLFELDMNPDNYLQSVEDEAKKSKVKLKIDNISYIDSKIGDPDLLEKWADDFLNRKNIVNNFQKNFQDLIGMFKRRKNIKFTEDEIDHFKKTKSELANHELWNLFLSVLRKMLQTLFSEFKIDSNKKIIDLINDINKNLHYVLTIPNRPLNDVRWMISVLINIRRSSKYEHIFIPEDVENILREIRSRINEEYHGENIKGNLFVDSMGDTESLIENKILEDLYEDSEISMSVIKNLGESIIKSFREIERSELLLTTHSKKRFNALYEHMIFLYSMQIGSDVK